MKIFGANEHVKEEFKKEPWYSLSVINMWDFKLIPICYRVVNGNKILYSLNLNTLISEEYGTWSSKKIEELTEEMENELITMGYILYSVKRN